MRKVHSDLGDRIYMVDEELDNKTPRKKGLLRKVGGGLMIATAALGIGASSGNFNNAEAATAHAHTNYEKSWKIAPPGFYKNGFNSRLRDAFVSRHNKTVTHDILFNDFKSSHWQKNGAWWYTLAHVGGKINDFVPRIFGTDRKKSKEAAFAIGIDQFVSVYELGGEVRSNFDDVNLSLTLAFLGFSGEPIKNPVKQVKDFRNLDFATKKNVLSRLNPSNLSAQDYNLTNWAIDAYMLACQRSGQTHLDEYKIIKDIKSRYNYPNVLI